MQTAAVAGGGIRLLQATALTGSSSRNPIIIIIRVRVQWSHKQANITVMPFSSNWNSIHRLHR
jgi:hypothetical protein